MAAAAHCHDEEQLAQGLLPSCLGYLPLFSTLTHQPALKYGAKRVHILLAVNVLAIQYPLMQSTVV